MGQDKVVFFFLHSTLRSQPEQSSPEPARSLVKLLTHTSPKGFNFTLEEIKAMINDDSEQLARLGLPPVGTLGPVE